MFLAPDFFGGGLALFNAAAVKHQLGHHIMMLRENGQATKKSVGTEADAF